jgi:hypothetical protein
MTAIMRMSDMNKYIYVPVIKSSGVPIQDMAFSRAEARECKALYESMYKESVSILRYEFQTKVR